MTIFQAFMILPRAFKKSRWQRADQPGFSGGSSKAP
jgi:hypothetical protein